MLGKPRHVFRLGGREICAGATPEINYRLIFNSMFVSTTAAFINIPDLTLEVFEVQFRCSMLLALAALRSLPNVLGCVQFKANTRYFDSICL